MRRRTIVFTDLTAHGARIGEAESSAKGRGGQRSLEICITCSNIKRPLVWPDNVTVRRKIRASRRLSHRFGLLLFLVCLVLSFSLFLYPSSLVLSIRSGPERIFFSSHRSLSSFWSGSSSRSLSTCLGSLLRVKAVARRNI